MIKRIRRLGIKSFDKKFLNLLKFKVECLLLLVLLLLLIFTAIELSFGD